MISTVLALEGFKHLSIYRVQRLHLPDFKALRSSTIDGYFQATTLRVFKMDVSVGLLLVDMIENKVPKWK